LLDYAFIAASGRDVIQCSNAVIVDSGGLGTELEQLGDFVVRIASQTEASFGF
jgi:hypothetical protein